MVDDNESPRGTLGEQFASAGLHWPLRAWHARSRSMLYRFGDTVLTSSTTKVCVEAAKVVDSTTLWGPAKGGGTAGAYSDHLRLPLWDLGAMLSDAHLRRPVAGQCPVACGRDVFGLGPLGTHDHRGQVPVRAHRGQDERCLVGASVAQRTVRDHEGCCCILRDDIGR